MNNQYQEEPRATRNTRRDGRYFGATPEEVAETFAMMELQEKERMEEEKREEERMEREFQNSSYVRDARRNAWYGIQ